MVKYLNYGSKYTSNFPYYLSSERTTVIFCTNLSIFKKFIVGNSKVDGRPQNANRLFPYNLNHADKLSIIR